MGRNTQSNRTGYNVRSKLYRSEILNDTEVIRKLELVIPIIFYAKDHVSFKYERNEVSGVMQRSNVSGVIETMDLKQSEIKIGDTVEYMGIKYNVEDVTFMDSNVQKEISTRPIVKTIIKLGTVVDG